MNRKKVVVKPIPIADNDMQFVNAVLSLNRSPYVKDQAVKRITGGYCTSCGGDIATHKAHYQIHGATVIEKYCDYCVRGLKFTG